ncbi:MAG: hypothetical protein IRY83_13795 [Chloroflexi bacterium]|nr:hypothetical protein [Chloroflexota bacterium]
MIVPHAVIEIDGERFDSFTNRALFEHVEVDLTTGQASEAIWRVFDPEFAWLDRWINSAGLRVLPVRIWLGADRLHEVFQGLLARVEHGRGATTFRFYDMSFRMRLEQKTRYHKNVNDLEIIGQLARENGLGFDGVSIRLERHRSIMQDGRTDWDFALERATDAGLVLFTRGQTLYAREAAKTGTPVLTLRYRDDFVMTHDFDLQYRVPENQEGRPGAVETRTRGRGGRRLSGRTARDRGTGQVEIKRDVAVKSRRAADARAEARKALEREHAFQASVVLLSSYDGPRPDVRDTVELANVGKLFSGRWLVDRVTHAFGPGRLDTRLELYRDITV